MMKPSLLTYLFILLSGLTGTLFAAGEPSEKLFQLINERLAYMKDVAAFKWENDKPIEDLDREAVVLEKSIVKAESEGLKANSIRPFFIAQITVAKNIQESWQREWEEKGFPNTLSFRDLKDVRLALLELGNEILTAIQPALPTLHDSSQRELLYASFMQSITVEKVTDKDKALIFEKLVEIKSGTVREEL